MAQYLYRLGRLAVRRRWAVLASWLLVLVLAAAGAATLSADTSDAFVLPGTESQQALDLLDEQMPGSGGATARVVFAAPDGQSLASEPNRAAIAETVANLVDAPGVVDVSDPFDADGVSDDGTVGYANVAYLDAAADLDETATGALEAAPEPARAAGLQVEFGGDALSEVPHSSSAEAIGVAVAIVVLLVTFGSVIAAGLPILTALVGVGIGLAGITAATGLVDMSSTAPTLAIMLGLAVGIDYALFIVTRYRQLLGTGIGSAEAVARAVATAGSAVVFAGLTVVIALVGLTVVGIPFLTVMGLCAAVTVVVAVLIAITLLPSLLAFAGDGIDRVGVPFVHVHRGLGSEKGAIGLRWGRFVRRRAAAVLGLVLVGLGVLAVPAASLQLGLPDDGSKPAEATARRAYDLLADGIGPGFNGPLVVVVDGRDAADPVAAATDLEAWLDTLPGVADVAAAQFNESGDVGIVSVIPETGPSSTETADLVHAIRDGAHSLEGSTGVDVAITGTAALNIDVSDTLADALPIYALLVVGLAIVLLMVAFRSVVVPIKAALGFVLSVAGSFGAVVAVFQWGWLRDVIGLDQTGPIISFLPILLIGVLFGLAMDYEVFLVSRIREDYVHGGDARAAVVEGVQHSARVITAAGLIMVAVFAAFVLGDDPTVKMIGFSLAVGVAVDAFVVRMTLVPAVLTLLADRAWWLPRWLDRVIPNIDIEGAGLVGSPAADAPDTTGEPGEPVGPLVGAGQET
jgi:RND superfamily putative drug exporter